MPPVPPPPDRADPAESDRHPRQIRSAGAHRPRLRHLLRARPVARLQRHQAHAHLPSRLPAPHSVSEKRRLGGHEEGDGGARHPGVSGLSAYAAIAIPLAVHGTFTYAIPPELRDSVRLGSRVEVPLGTKRTTGFVVALLDDAADVDTAKVKPIRAVLDDEEPALLPEIIELCRWAAEYYLAPLGEMLRVALPANMAARGRRQAELTATREMIDAALQRKQILEADLPLVAELEK